MEPETGRQFNTSEYKHSQLTDRIIAGFYDTYNELGFGFLESVYEEALVRVLRTDGLTVDRQVQIPIWFRGEKISDFFVDLIVNKSVLLELKAVKVLEPCHEAQILNYLRATPIEVGLILNFGPRPVVRRFAFANDRKKISVDRCLSAAKGDVRG